MYFEPVTRYVTIWKFREAGLEQHGEKGQVIYFDAVFAIVISVQVWWSCVSFADCEWVEAEVLDLIFFLSR